MTYVGIDVSKLTFVVAYSSAKTSKTKTFKNTAKGIREFIKTISVDEHHCVMEATGNYSTLLVYMLSEFGFTVSLENPLKIKNFSRVMLSVIKSDEIDARLIALYGEKMQPSPYRMRSDSILILKQKRTVLRQLKKQLVATSNLKGSMEVLPIYDSKCKKTIEKTIAFLEKQILCRIAGDGKLREDKDLDALLRSASHHLYYPIAIEGRIRNPENRGNCPDLYKSIVHISIVS